MRPLCLMHILSKGTGSFIIIDRLTNVTVGAGMITGHSSDAELNDVSSEERAARFGQKAVTISLSGTHSEQMAYQLERKLFDAGHAATVITNNLSNIDETIAVVKQAGLICLCTTSNSGDISFDTDKISMEQIHQALKEQNIIQ